MTRNNGIELQWVNPAADTGSSYQWDATVPCAQHQALAIDVGGGPRVECVPMHLTRQLRRQIHASRGATACSDVISAKRHELAAVRLPAHQDRLAASRYDY